MVAGCSNTVASKSYCHRQYAIARGTQLYWSLQNTWRYPTAQTYVERLLQEAPAAKEPLCQQLAVMTNVSSTGGSSYFVAEELAVSAGMDILLLGKNFKRLKTIENRILAEAKQRQRATPSSSSNRKPKILKVKYDSNSLASLLEAAQSVIHIANEEYGGKIPIFIENPSGVTAAYETTENGVEINVGRNFVAPHMLTQQLLPLIKAAATPTYKPRVVYVSSVGHCQGTDFDPERLLATPKEGGAPEDTFAADADDEDKLTFLKNELDGGVFMYYRSKMALIADAIALAKEEPSLVTVSVYPGSVATSSHSKTQSLGIAEMCYQTTFSLFQLQPTQGARASLRAALDPDFNTLANPDLQGGAYLHCDGNPWTVADPTLENPNAPEEPFYLADYATTVRDCTKKLCETLLANIDTTPTSSTVDGECDKDDENDDGVDKDEESDKKKENDTQNAADPIDGNDTPTTER